MPARTLAPARFRSIALRLDTVAILLFGVLSVQYFVAATTLARGAPFWMDEVLSVWAARLPDTRAIWSALVHGAEFSPPLYDLLLHALGTIGVTSAFGLRLPSILAIFLAAIAAAVVVRRRASVASAVLAAGVMLSSGLFGYAVQARPYALVTAVFAWAFVLFDRPDNGPADSPAKGPGNAPSARRLAALAVLLVIAIGLHFYALLLAGGLIVLELVRSSLERRAPDWRTLATIALASSSLFLWWPILAAARTYSGADVAASAYYARPTLVALVRTYARLLGWLILPLGALLSAVVALGDRRPLRSRLRITAMLLSAIPVGVWLFALLVSHSYADRYALAGVLGIALLFGALVERLGRWSAPVSVLLLASFLVGNAYRAPGEIDKTDRLEALATIAAAPGTIPIVTGSGLRFFEFYETARPSIRRRLRFLDIPDAPSTDPTNRHQLLRWKALEPGLPVDDAHAFLCATPAFLLFAQPDDGGADALPGWLASRAYFTPPPNDRASLTPIRSRPCNG